MESGIPRNSVVVDSSRSPHARLRPVPIGAVHLEDCVWAPRLKVNLRTTLPSQHRHLEQSGHIDNFRRAAGKKDVPFQGRYYNDSDVYKWMEAAAWALAAGETQPEAAVLQRMLDDIITEVAAAQQPDGYLNTWFTFDLAGERWSNLRDKHELYCAGHLIQAAVAHRRATGAMTLLHVARWLANCICRTFGPGEGQRMGTCGHEEVEMALVELARETGDPRYLNQAKYFIDVRGRGLIGGSDYHQDKTPLRESRRMVGHAVRQVYLTAGATDLVLETGDPAIREALERMWRSMTTWQMYVSGGIGSRWTGEAFGNDYELPNERAYAETCAAIGSVMWNWRMLLLSGEARFADLIEWTLYNAVLPGLSLDGQRYFYQNPLANEGSHRRQEWFGCACCPPNIARTLASLGGYFYSTSGDEIWVHLYADGFADIRLNDRFVQLVQRTVYPWDGTIRIEVRSAGDFTLRLRVPGWCDRGGKLAIDGSEIEDELRPGSYAAVRRAWNGTETVELMLPMPVRRIESHPYVMENTGRVALARGPILYCIEQADHPGVELRDLVVPDEAALLPDHRPELLGGVTVLRGRARVAPPDEAWTGRLYRLQISGPKHEIKNAVELTAVPYYTWANRAAGAMRVWLRRGC